MSINYCVQNFMKSMIRLHRVTVHEKKKKNHHIINTKCALLELTSDSENILTFLPRNFTILLR